MQGIKELILLCQQHNMCSLAQPANGKFTDTNLIRLYEEIRSGHFLADADAVAEIPGYVSLKHALREILIADIRQIFSVVELSDDYDRAFCQCQQLWLGIRMLTGQNAAILAPDLASRLLKLTQKFDFTRLNMEISAFQRIHYCLREYQSDRCAEADRSYQRYRQVFKAEFEIEEKYLFLTGLAVNNRSGQKKIKRLAKSDFESIRPWMQTHSGYKVQLFGNLIGLTCFIACEDYQNALKICERAIRFFESRPYPVRAALQIFYYQALICNTQLRRYTAGRKAAERCIALAQEGDFNWFKFRELYVVLLLHTRRYEQAAAIFSETRKQPQFVFLPDYTQEIWDTMHMLLYFLQTVDAISVPLLETGQVLKGPWIASDKRADVCNARLILKFLWHIRNGDQAILDEASALIGQYIRQHLKGENTRRSYYFLKMLQQVPAVHFDCRKAKARAARFLEKMNAIPVQLSNQTMEMELAPYEDVWAMVLKILPKSR
ncbi:MAG: hypothetical protein IPM81_20480 [Saprospirales bacterium]|nr:hypothetical protein [Saprospirales bacterium]